MASETSPSLTVAKDQQKPSSMTKTEDSSETASPEMDENPEEQVNKKLPYPKSVIFIVFSNFTERFSYNGIKVLLTLYFVQKMYFTPNSATITYHVFTSLSYFSALLGAIIADGRLGKFKTIVYFTLIYVVGGILLSGSTIPNRFWGLTGVKIVASVSLIFIAIGSGCTKPCLAAFGGDQFGPGQEKQLRRFFSIFYVSISCGSLIALFITPILRSNQCMGNNDCYVMGFGVPALTITLSLISIAIGKKWYIIHPPGPSVIFNVMSCVCYALRRKCKARGDEQKKESWLDYADDKYDRALINDVKCLLKIFVLYIPLPLFYTLHDQQGSRWTLQATHLDGRITNELYVQPEHMQLLDPLITVVGVPFFEFIVYPICAKVNFLVKPLQRMVVGGLLAAVAFFVACLLQMSIEKANDTKTEPSTGTGTVMFLNAAPCRLGVYSDFANTNFTSDEILTFHNIPNEFEQTVKVQPMNCPPKIDKAQFTLEIKSGEVTSIILTIVDNELHYYLREDSLKKSENGKAAVRIFFHIPEEEIKLNSTFTFVQMGTRYYTTVKLLLSDLQGNHVGSTNYTHLNPGSYRLYIGDSRYDVPFSETLEFAPGGRYIVLLSPAKDGVLKAHRLTVTVPNRLSMFLQLPQYILITFSEIMFAITGIEFSYSQAPPSMKSLVQGSWLMLIAIGNLIMVIVSKTSSFRLSTESLAFAVAMVIDMIIFSFMAHHYSNVNHELGVKPLQGELVKTKENTETELKTEKPTSGF